MSLGQFLSRWSRRKASAGTGTSTESSAEVGASADLEQDTSVPVDVSPIDLASLPSLDDISAETDIQAFLTPGIPFDLTRAALRRAWSVDTEIRDYIGPSDYAWDFNAPDTMLGFGPLKMSDELRDELVKAMFEAPQPPANENPVEDGVEMSSLSRESPSNAAIAVEPSEPVSIMDEESLSTDTEEPTSFPRHRRGGGALPA